MFGSCMNTEPHICDGVHLDFPDAISGSCRPALLTHLSKNSLRNLECRRLITGQKPGFKSDVWSAHPRWQLNGFIDRASGMPNFKPNIHNMYKNLLDHLGGSGGDSDESVETIYRHRVRT